MDRIEMDKKFRKLAQNAGVYFDFSKESLQQIVSKDITEVEPSEFRACLQALFPSKFICSGLIDRVLLFNLSDKGYRIDPPEQYWSGLKTINKFHEKSLLERIIELFKENGLQIHDSWIKEANNEQDRIY